MKRALSTTRRQVEIQTVIKSSRPGWFWLVPGVCMIAVGANASSMPEDALLFLFAMLSGFGVLTAVWLSHRIVVSSAEIRIYQLFSKTSLPLARIEHFDLRRLKAEHYLLEISGSDLPASPLSFDLFAYSPSAIISLVRTVKRYMPQIALNRDARNAFQGYLS